MMEGPLKPTTYLVGDSSYGHLDLVAKITKYALTHREQLTGSKLTISVALATDGKGIVRNAIPGQEPAKTWKYAITCSDEALLETLRTDDDILELRAFEPQQMASLPKQFDVSPNEKYTIPDNQAVGYVTHRVNLKF